MASEDLTIRMRAAGARTAARDVDRTTGSVKRLGRESDRSRKSARLLSTGLKGIGFAAVGFAAVAKSSISAASDLSEEINKASVIFGKSKGSILAWSKTSASAFGMSRAEALSAAGNFGGFFKVAGKGQAEAAGLSKSMVGLAADMASFNNSSPAETLAALRSGLSGESEPLRKHRVFLNDARVASEGVAMGLVKQGAKMTDAHKIMARYSLILKDTKDAQGDFARTSKSLANQKRILAAQMTNLKATLGLALLPTINKGILLFRRFVEQIQSNTGAGGRLRGVVVGLANTLGSMFGFVKRNSTALLSLGAGLATFIVLTKAWAVTSAAAAFATGGWVTAFWALNAAMRANPVGLVITGIALLVGGLVLAYQKSETFRNAVNSVGGALKSVGSFIGGAFISTINVFIRGINLAIKAINLLIKAKNLLPGKDTPLVGEVGLLAGGLGDKGGSSATSGAATLGRRARGGPIERTGVYEVGERGPERVHLPAGATVEPYGAGGGEIVIHNYLQVGSKVLATSTAREAIKAKAMR